MDPALSPNTNLAWSTVTDLRLPDKGALKLRDQNELVRKVTSTAFNMLQTSIMFRHAFPNALLTTDFILEALLAAISRLPTATPGAAEMRERILIDHGYLAKLSMLVCHMPHFHIFFFQYL